MIERSYFCEIVRNAKLPPTYCIALSRTFPRCYSICSYNFTFLVLSQQTTTNRCLGWVGPAWSRNGRKRATSVRRRRRALHSRFCNRKSARSLDCSTAREMRVKRADIRAGESTGRWSGHWEQDRTRMDARPRAWRWCPQPTGRDARRPLPDARHPK